MTIKQRISNFIAKHIIADDPYQHDPNYNNQAQSNLDRMDGRAVNPNNPNYNNNNNNYNNKGK